MKHWMATLACLAPLIGSGGCGQARPAPAPEQPASPPEVSFFDAAATGTIRGQVFWKGDRPKVPPFVIHTIVNAADPPVPRKSYENPNAPSIDVDAGGVAGAVVYLRKVDPRLARPWDHPPVVVEHRDRRLEILQGGVLSRVGFVKQGSAISIVSREKLFNSLHGRGAEFFSLPFPDPDKPLSRVLHDKGFVELSSGAGYIWMRAFLFVSDHPYLARTDAKGVFELCQVPTGRYQIVCWLPNWQIKTQDRDPETRQVTRVFFQPALQEEHEVVVKAGGDARVEFGIQCRTD